MRAPTGRMARRALVVGTRGPAPGAGPVEGMRFPLTERLSCPVSAAASAASAAPSPAGRPASAGRAATAGVARVVTVGGRTAPVARPPAVSAAAAVAAPAGARPARPPPGPGPGRTRGAPARHESPDHQGCDHEQDDPCNHGSTLLPFPGPRPEVPRSSPPSDASPRVGCLSPACGSRREAHRRAREMPLAATPQSRVEEVLRVPKQERPLTCTGVRARGRWRLAGPSTGRQRLPGRTGTRSRWPAGPVRGCRASSGRTPAGSYPDQHDPCTR